MFSMSLPNTNNFLVGYQLRLGISAPPHFPDEKNVPETVTP